LIHACIYDKPEMVLLLLNKGASLNLPCDNGFTPEEHARINNSIYALAQIIIVKA
jgi:ankyrin repeat protein